MTLALVLGGAQCVWKDVLAVYQRTTPDIVIATNDMIAQWPLPVEHVATLHTEHLPRWLALRQAAGRNRPPHVWAHAVAPGVTDVTADWQGSVALLALKIALKHLRATGAVLAGVPLDRSSHFVRPGPWKDAHTFFAGWVKHKDDVAAQTRAVSGWTRAVFGEPSAKWLASIEANNADLSLVEMLEPLAA